MLVPCVRDGQFLGKGASKRVVAQRRRGGLVAVMTSADDLTHEAGIMLALSLAPHPHLLPLLAIEFDTLSSLAITTPIARFGSMYDLADHLEFEGLALSLADASVAVLQVANALMHLASIGIQHGDVSARNVLVHNYKPHAPASMHVCLGDFGEARLLEKPSVNASVLSVAGEVFALLEA